MIDWNSLIVERLRELVATSLSASQIGAAMGISRNAVIGKCHRMKIKLLGTSSGGGYHPRRSDRIGEPKVVRIERAPPSIPIPEPSVLLAAYNASRLDKAQPITSLNRCDCRWPVSGENDPLLFCAAACDDGHPYCSTHYPYGILDSPRGGVLLFKRSRSSTPPSILAQMGNRSARRRAVTVAKSA